MLLLVYAFARFRALHINAVALLESSRSRTNVSRMGASCLCCPFIGARRTSGSVINCSWLLCTWSFFLCCCLCGHFPRNRKVGLFRWRRIVVAVLSVQFSRLLSSLLLPPPLLQPVFLRALSSSFLVARLAAARSSFLPPASCTFAPCFMSPRATWFRFLLYFRTRGRPSNVRSVCWECVGP